MRRTAAPSQIGRPVREFRPADSRRSHQLPLPRARLARRDARPHDWPGRQAWRSPAIRWPAPVDAPYDQQDPACFEWVGRAIDPYLGFLTGWLMIAAYIIATVSGVEVLGPSVLTVFGSSSTSTWANIAIGTAAGSYPITKGWFSLSGVGWHGDAAAGFLIAVFMFTGWDGTVYVNEDVRHRRVNPGRAARFVLRSSFFDTQRESDTGPGGGGCGTGLIPGPPQHRIRLRPGA